MIRTGQYSLVYLFLMSFWIALTVCFGRYTMIYLTDFTSSHAEFLGIMSMYEAILCGSIVVGGFFKCMRGGALAGCVFIFVCSLITIVMMSIS